MNACIYVGYLDNEWIWETFPGKSPAELPVAGKSWIRHTVDLCSLLKVPNIFVADCFFHPELPARLGDGSYWSTKIEYLPCTDSINLRQLFEQHEDKKPTGDLLIFWGQVLPDLPDIEMLLKELHPVETAPDQPLPTGIYLLRDGKLLQCVCPLLRMDSVQHYFDLNMRILNRPGIYNLPGYSSERNFGIGRNVITMFGCRLNPPLVIQDDSGLGRGTVLDGDVVIGSRVLIDDGTYLKRTIIFDNTYIGRNMHLEDKIVSEHMVIDVKSGVHVEIDDDFMAGRSKRSTGDRLAATEFILTLLLLILLLPSWLLALPFRKFFSRLPFYNYVLKAYPKLPGVLAGHTRLVRNGVRDNSYVFRFSDQYLLMRDEHYRDMADVFFSTHRSARAIIAVVCTTLFKRMTTLTEPRSGASEK
jgi:NDP-sugar pyrophosphorylase family protein